MVGAGVRADAAGKRVREIADDGEAVAEFFERREAFGESKPLPSAAGVHLYIVAPWGT